MPNPDIRILSGFFVQVHIGPYILFNNCKWHGGHVGLLMKITRNSSGDEIANDFLLVINSNVPPILHRFWYIAVDRSKIAIFGYPCCVYLPRRRGSPGTISVKFYLDVNRWPRYLWRRNIAENFNRLSRVHQRYRRQTDGRRHIANVNVSSRSLKMQYR